MSSNTNSKKQVNNLSGSPQTGEPVYLVIGKLRRSHGLRGEIKMDVMTDFPERIKKGLHVFIGKTKEEHVLDLIRPALKHMLISLDGFADCDSVKKFTNQLVYIKTTNNDPLPPGELYHHQIIGMRVLDESNKEIGIISEILITGANDVYVVDRGKGEELLVPAIKSVVVEMNAEENIMRVNLPEWS